MKTHSQLINERDAKIDKLTDTFLDKVELLNQEMDAKIQPLKDELEFGIESVKQEYDDLLAKIPQNEEIQKAMVLLRENGYVVE